MKLRMWELTLAEMWAKWSTMRDSSAGPSTAWCEAGVGRSLYSWTGGHLSGSGTGWQRLRLAIYDEMGSPGGTRGVMSVSRARISVGEHSLLHPSISDGGVTSDSRAGRDYSKGRCRRRIKCHHSRKRCGAKCLQVKSARMQTKFKYERIQDKCTAQADGQQRQSKGVRG
jgi:hypothetical protein